MQGIVTDDTNWTTHTKFMPNLDADYEWQSFHNVLTLQPNNQPNSLLFFHKIANIRS